MLSPASVSSLSTAASPQSTSTLRLPLLDDESNTDITLPHFQQHIEVTKTLYHGRKGKVCKAKGTDDVDYAVKETKITSCEANVYAALQDNDDHPGVVRTLGLTDHASLTGSDSVFLVMELCVTDLRAYMTREKTITEELVRHIFQQVLAALSFCHRKGVIHRDIKPENILLRNSSSPISVCICDFDVAVRHHPAGSPVGTPNYIAPEVLDGHRCSNKADTYSAGCVLKELLDTVDEPGVSKEARDLCEKLTQENPNVRLDSRQALQHSWFKMHGNTKHSSTGTTV